MILHYFTKAKWKISNTQEHIMLFKIKFNPNEIISTLCLSPRSIHEFNGLLFARMVESERVTRAGLNC